MDLVSFRNDLSLTRIANEPDSATTTTTSNGPDDVATACETIDAMLSVLFRSMGLTTGPLWSSVQETAVEVMKQAVPLSEPASVLYGVAGWSLDAVCFTVVSLAFKYWYDDGTIDGGDAWDAACGCIEMMTQWPSLMLATMDTADGDRFHWNLNLRGPRERDLFLRIRIPLPARDESEWWL